MTEVTPDGQVRYASPNHEKLLRYAPKELVGGSLLCIVDPGDAAVVPGRIIEGREPVAWRALHKNGTVLWMESSGRTFRANNGEIRGVIVSRDVTERWRMEVEFPA